MLGAALSLYLLVQHTRLKSGIQDGASFCSFGAFADCDSVNVSAYSEIAEIPIAAIGACLYFALLLFSLLGSVREKDRLAIQRWIASLAFVGLLYDAYLFLVQLIVLKNFCVLCLLTYFFTLTIFLTATGILTGKVFNFKAMSRALLNGPALSEPFRAPSPILLITFLAFVCFAVLVAFIPSHVRLGSYSFVNSAMDQFLAQWKEQPIRKISVKPGDGTFGNPNAKIQIVEFSDFECPYCHKAAFTLHTVLKNFKDRVFFVFKHFPLDSNCNPKVPVQMHPHACELSRLAFCAAKKNAFWKFHDRVFFDLESGEGEEKLDLPKEVAQGSLKSVFTEAEYRECNRNSAAAHNTQEDLRLAESMGVKGTPSLFINGKSVKIPITLENLERLIKIEESL